MTSLAFSPRQHCRMGPTAMKATSPGEPSHARPKPQWLSNVVDRIGFAGLVGVSVLLGTILGGMIFEFMEAPLERLAQQFNIPRLRLYVSVATGVLASGYAVFFHASAVSEERRWFAVLTQLDFEKPGRPEIWQRLNELSPGNKLARFREGNIRVREAPGCLLIMCRLDDVTVAIFESTTMSLADFSLRPERITDNVFSKIGGAQDIDFQTSPEFSHQYFLAATDEPQLRELFNEPVLEFFSRKPGVILESRLNRLMMTFASKSGHCPIDELPNFVANTLEVFSLFNEAAGTLAQHHSADSGAPSQAGLETQSQHDDVQRLLKQAPPREIPQRLRRVVLGHDCTISAVLGTAFLVIGAWFVVGSDDPVMNWGGGLPFMLLGFLSGGLSVTWRRQRLRTLREGSVTKGTITSVREASDSTPNKPRYRATVTFTVEGVEHQAKSACDRVTAETVASDDQGDGTIQLLYDPHAPRRAVLTDWLRNA